MKSLILGRILTEWSLHFPTRGLRERCSDGQRDHAPIVELADASCIGAFRIVVRDKHLKY